MKCNVCDEEFDPGSLQEVFRHEHKRLPMPVPDMKGRLIETWSIRAEAHRQAAEFAEKENEQLRSRMKTLEEALEEMLEHNGPERHGKDCDVIVEGNTVQCVCDDPYQNARNLLDSAN